MARPRIKDVALRAGVSEKTVSNVINDYVHVSERTRRVVRQAIDDLGYRVNLAGRHLRRGRTGIIALVVPELDLPYFAELANLIVAEAERNGLTVLVHQTRAVREHELSALDGFGSDFADGVILSPLALVDEDLRSRSGALPTVLLGEKLSAGCADHVAIDNAAAAREATEHLLQLGRRRILVVGGFDGESEGTAEVRTRGHRAALAAAGVPFDPQLVVPVAKFATPDGAAATHRALTDGLAPDAVLALNDQMAIGAVRALHERGLRVPEDVAVVGFDDVEAGRYSVPTLTTVAPDKAEIAAVAVALLIGRIAEARGQGAGGPADAPGSVSADGAPAGAAGGAPGMNGAAPAHGGVNGAAAPAGSPARARAGRVQPPHERVVPHRLVIRESTSGARKSTVPGPRAGD
ncbi:LacI family DNA-binding transcriptional regulator [Streptomyces sp. 3MP-14]|uniref:LacI family DNA-binding transcriptional regulator n=1 Tax=Streptomyces mimosae TaxID=2586635 RepID=A0A5N6A9L0_9ACTN|nr:MULTISPECIES: LacI family DNA-binding transcriptional regulator [Streptomyces]KAB8164626.1 LacI family DNA-binding transcriptional regulator [Streptomyces mimosae]KAB8175542.1 LacI family DNA-binding transcriptional regulator [Streptomyces sp. 3MP-14]